MPGKPPEDNYKKCRDCKQRKPIREFDLPKHRQCSACKRRRYTEAGIDWAVAPAGQAALPSSNSSRAAWNKYQREYHRRLARDKPDRRIKRADYEPPAFRICTECKRELPASMFATPRVRLCRTCDTPKLREVMPKIIPMPPYERGQRVQRLRDGALGTVVSIGILSVGVQFDHRAPGALRRCTFDTLRPV